MFTFAHSFNQGLGRSMRMAQRQYARATGVWCTALIERAGAIASIAVNPRMGKAHTELPGMGLDARTNSGRVLI